MSPIIARTAMRAAGRRNFSIMTSMRKFARGFEPHPFSRLPVTSNPQAADWGKQVKRLSTQVVLFVPGMAVILGWPYGAKVLMDGHIA